jgi:hypothetical protein
MSGSTPRGNIGTTNNAANATAASGAIGGGAARGSFSHNNPLGRPRDAFSGLSGLGGIGK